MSQEPKIEPPRMKILEEREDGDHVILTLEINAAMSKVLYQLGFEALIDGLLETEKRLSGGKT